MRKISCIVILATLLFSYPLSLYAQDSTSTPASSSDSSEKSSLENRKRELEEKLKQVSKQKDTLSSQIEYMDTQVYLTEVKVQQTEAQIEKTEKEIDSLTSRIEGLDKSLNNLSETLIGRVVDGYKNRRVSMFEYFLDSENANEFLGQVKYQKTAQENNQRLLFQVQQTKSNFQDQKKLREKKVAELARQKDQLAVLRQELVDQQEAKRKLLEATKNDEVTYQRLLSETKKALASFQTFTNQYNLGFSSFGNGSDGWYFSQRDPKWGGMSIGNSPYSVLQSGCALTSVAMVCRSYGQSVDPGIIAADNSRFISGDMYNKYFSCDGRSGNWFWTISEDTVRSYVERKIPVILKVEAVSSSGFHFVVAKEMRDGEIIIHDPYFGPDLKFSEKYSFSNVVSAVVIQ